VDINAQRESLVLLKNGQEAGNPVLPLTQRPKIYIENINPDIARTYADIVATPEEADFAIIRIETPYEQRDGFIESALHAGDLDFKNPEKARLLELLETVPTIVNIYVDRGVVMPDISNASAALVADFGAQDTVILDMVFGASIPTGKLPIELPSSLESAANQYEDVPFDSQAPLYSFGFGLAYKTEEGE